MVVPIVSLGRSATSTFAKYEGWMPLAGGDFQPLLATSTRSRTHATMHIVALACHSVEMHVGGSSVDLGFGGLLRKSGLQ